MIDYAKRLREPVLIVLSAVIACFIFVAIGQFVVLLRQGASIAGAASQAGASSASLIWFFGVVAVALLCLLVRPATRNAQRLVGIAAGVAAVATAVAAVFWILGLFGGLSFGQALSALGGLIETLVKAGCAVVLWRLRAVSVDEHGRIEQAIAATGDDPGRAPVWEPGAAVGRQWARAGDAATGSAAGEPMLRPALEPPPAAPRAVPAPWSRGGRSPEQLSEGAAAASSAQPAAAEPAAAGEPDAATPAPDPGPRLPWTTAGEAAQGSQPAPADDGGPDQQRESDEQRESDASAPAGRRPPPDWTPAPRD